MHPSAFLTLTLTLMARECTWLLGVNLNHSGALRHESALCHPSQCTEPSVHLAIMKVVSTALRMTIWLTMTSKAI